MAARATCGCGWIGGPYATSSRAEAMAAKHVCAKADSVRRATRRHRCARCGHTAVYENAGAAEARYWFGKHSCQKVERRMLAAALAEAREALIDRTPQPCLHKVANHQHGTRACYCLDKCRCIPCSKANSAAENERTRLKAYGRYNKYVPAEFVRDHLTELKNYGIGLKQVSKLSGVSNGSLTKIWYGKYADTGRGAERRHGEGELERGPSRRVLRATAEKIFAVEAVPANLGAARPDHERTPTARLHLRGLVALGWSQSKLASRLGMQPGNFGRTIGGDQPMRRDTVDAIEALYGELSMTLPPEANHRDRIAASRSRNYAKAHGWLPPLALDEPDWAETEPITEDVDEVAVRRRMNGDKSVRLNVAEKAHLVRAWQAAGRPLNECERVTGLNPHRYIERTSA